jgi:hypothetical protein
MLIEQWGALWRALWCRVKTMVVPVLQRAGFG